MRFQISFVQKNMDRNSCNTRLNCHYSYKRNKSFVGQPFRVALSKAKALRYM